MRIEVDGLSKRLGGIDALDEAGFEVRGGEVTGIIGPNGAGKTTLLECMAGLLAADRGSLRVDGKPVASNRRTEFFYYVPDGIAPWASQPVAWVLEFAAGFFGGDPAVCRDAIRRLGLEPFLRQPVGTLSKGQRKRTLLAVGLITPQPVLLIDEPFDGLDLRQTREIGAALREHATRGRTLVFSIHQIADAERFCDRFVLLSAGRVRGQGTLAELAPAGESLEQVFLALT